PLKDLHILETSPSNSSFALRSERSYHHFVPTARARPAIISIPVLPANFLICRGSLFAGELINVYLPLFLFYSALHFCPARTRNLHSHGSRGSSTHPLELLFC